MTLSDKNMEEVTGGTEIIPTEEQKPPVSGNKAESDLGGIRLVAGIPSTEKYTCNTLDCPMKGVIFNMLGVCQNCGKPLSKRT